MEKQGKPFGLPELEAGQYLVDALTDAGFTVFDAMGERPLSWQDLDAYARCSGGFWEHWELRALRSMSLAYLSAKQAGADPLAIPPCEDQDGGK